MDEDQKKSASFRINLITFITCLIVMSGLGNLYAFGAYAADLKEFFNYSQSDLSVVSGIGDFGGSIAGVPMGIFYDRYGPTKTYMVSSFFLFGGYFLVYLSLRKIVFFTAVPVGIYLFTSGFGSSSAYYPSMGTNLKNFSKEHHGKIAGILIGMYGISAAIITQIYKLFF